MTGALSTSDNGGTAAPGGTGRRRPAKSPQEQARRKAWGYRQSALNRAAIEQARRDN